MRKTVTEPVLMQRACEGRLLIASLTAEVVCAYLAEHKVSVDQVPKLVSDIYKSFEKAGNANANRISRQNQLIRTTVFDDAIVCLEDGQRFKSLRRHLRFAHGLSPEEYREKWKLPETYPMVAPAYSAKRSVLAKMSGLGLTGAGRKRRRSV